MNNLRQIRSALYRLKRNMGTTIVVVKVSAGTVNLQTGVITPSEVKTTVRHAVMLPQQTNREFAYDLAYIAVNKNFTYGADYDSSQRFCIVDRRDYAAIAQLTNNDYIEYRSVRWNVESVQLDEFDQHALLRLQSVDNRAAT